MVPPPPTSTMPPPTKAKAANANNVLCNSSSTSARQVAHRPDSAVATRPVTNLSKPTGGTVTRAVRCSSPEDVSNDGPQIADQHDSRVWSSSSTSSGVKHHPHRDGHDARETTTQRPSAAPTTTKNGDNRQHEGESVKQPKIRKSSSKMLLTSHETSSSCSSQVIHTQRVEVYYSSYMETIPPSGAYNNKAHERGMDPMQVKKTGVSHTTDAHIHKTDRPPPVSLKEAPSTLGPQDQIAPPSEIGKCPASHEESRHPATSAQVDQRTNTGPVKTVSASNTVGAKAVRPTAERTLVQGENHRKLSVATTYEQDLPGSTIRGGDINKHLPRPPSVASSTSSSNTIRPGARSPSSDISSCSTASYRIAIDTFSSEDDRDVPTTSTPAVAAPLHSVTTASLLSHPSSVDNIKTKQATVESARELQPPRVSAATRGVSHTPQHTENSNHSANSKQTRQQQSTTMPQHRESANTSNSIVQKSTSTKNHLVGEKSPERPLVTAHKKDQPLLIGAHKDLPTSISGNKPILPSPPAKGISSQQNDIKLEPHIPTRRDQDSHGATPITSPANVNKSSIRPESQDISTSKPSRRPSQKLVVDKVKSDSPAAVVVGPPMSLQITDRQPDKDSTRSTNNMVISREHLPPPLPPKSVHEPRVSNEDDSGFAAHEPGNVVPSDTVIEHRRPSMEDPASSRTQPPDKVVPFLLRKPRTDVSGQSSSLTKGSVTTKNAFTKLRLSQVHQGTTIDLPRMMIYYINACDCEEIDEAKHWVTVLADSITEGLQNLALPMEPTELQDALSMMDASLERFAWHRAKTSEVGTLGEVSTIAYRVIYDLLALLRYLKERLEAREDNQTPQLQAGRNRSNSAAPSISSVKRSAFRKRVERFFFPKAFRSENNLTARSTSPTPVPAVTTAASNTISKKRDDLPESDIPAPMSIRDSCLFLSNMLGTYLDFSDAVAKHEVLLGPNNTPIAATYTGWVHLLTAYPEDENRTISPDLIEAFFSFFRNFGSPKETFDILVSQYAEACKNIVEGESPHQHLVLVKTEVVNIIGRWLQFYWRQEDNYIQDLMKEFIFGSVIKDVDIPEEPASRLSNAMIHVLRSVDGHEEPSEAKVQGPEETCFKDLSALSGLSLQELSSVNITRFCGPGGAQVLARELTLVESSYFHSFSLDDIYEWKAPDRKFKTVCSEWARFSNGLHIWAIQSIIDQPSPSVRTAVMMLLIDTAMVCHSSRNFSSAMQLTLALMSKNIQQLIVTLAEVPQTSLGNLKMLEIFYDPIQISNYWNELQAKSSPAVPVMAYLNKRFLTIVEKETPWSHHDHDGKKLRFFNFEYHRLLCREVQAMTKYYSPRHSLTQIDAVHQWLNIKVTPLSIDEFHTTQHRLDDKSIKLKAEEDMLMTRK